MRLLLMVFAFAAVAAEPESTVVRLKIRPGCEPTFARPAGWKQSGEHYLYVNPSGTKHVQSSIDPMGAVITIVPVGRHQNGVSRLDAELVQAMRERGAVARSRNGSIEIVYQGSDRWKDRTYRVLERQACGEHLLVRLEFTHTRTRAEKWFPIQDRVANSIQNIPYLPLK